MYYVWDIETEEVTTVESDSPHSAVEEVAKRKWEEIGERKGPNQFLFLCQGRVHRVIRHYKPVYHIEDWEAPPRPERRSHECDGWECHTCWLTTKSVLEFERLEKKIASLKQKDAEVTNLESSLKEFEI